MIEPKELITESILFSANWKEDERRKQYVYLTKTKLYRCEYHENFKSYNCFHVCLVKDFGDIHLQSHSYVPVGCLDTSCKNCVTISSRYSRNRLAVIDFPTSEEGAKTAAQLYVALAKVME